MYIHAVPLSIDYICSHVVCPPPQSLRHMCRRMPAREDIEQIESFRLKMILRWVASFLALLVIVCSLVSPVPSGLFVNKSYNCFFFCFSRLLQIASFSGKMNALNEVCDMLLADPQMFN